MTTDPAPHADRDSSEEPRRYAEGGQLSSLLAKPPTARCVRCWRYSWSADDVDTLCQMLQPDRTRCPGMLRATQNAAGAPQTPSGQSGTSRPEIAREERVQRYATALDLHSFRLASTSWQRFVLRVLAVADAEQEALRAEAERLTEAIYRQGAAIDRARMERAQAEDAETAATERAAAAEAERDRLARLLGSHADGHRCTCTVVRAGTPGVEPDEWEQDPWCPTHPDVDQVRPEFDRLAGIVEQVRALHVDDGGGYCNACPGLTLWPEECRTLPALDSQAPTEGSQP